MLHLASAAKNHGICPRNDWAEARMFAEAALLGHIDCLQAAYRFGYRMDELTLSVALTEGNAECVDFILRDGFKTRGMKLTYSLAVLSGHIECAQVLLRHGVTWDGQELWTAIIIKCPDFLRFLLQHGCTERPTSVYVAAGEINVECVKVLRKFGMPWNELILIIAQTVDNYDLIHYAVENGCPNPMGIPARRSARLMERR